MIIRIEDDFDLEKIMVSGQCFRARKMNTGSYRFITGSHILYIKETRDCEFECSCSEDEWSAVWHPYFDLDRDYRAVRERSAVKMNLLTMQWRWGRESGF